MPCSEKRARLLLKRGRARVHRMYPFTIRLIDRKSGATQPLQLKIDPGSKQTGVAIVRQAEATAAVVALIEIKHRGAAIRKALQQRAAFRRRRRSAKLRYRAPRFDNRRRARRLARAIPAPSRRHRDGDRRALAASRAGHGHRAGAGSIRYAADGEPGDLRRRVPARNAGRVRGSRVSAGEVGPQMRLLRCRKRAAEHRSCSSALARRIRSRHEPGAGLCSVQPDKGRPERGGVPSRDPNRLARIKNQLKAPLKDAAAVNATRWALYRALAATGIPVSTGSGGRTKFNRLRFSIPKTHALDAVCAGNMELITAVRGWQQPTLVISANGRGSYKRTRLTANGFPRGYLMRSKSVHGFTTGDMVRAIVTAGKKQGSYIARVAVRASGSFNLQTAGGVIQGVSHKHCRLLQRADGYGYQLQKSTKGTAGRPVEAGVLTHAQRYPSPA